MVEKYIKEYCEGFDFKPYKKHSEKVCDIIIESDISLFFEGINRRTKSHVVFRKDNAVYECDRVNTENLKISLITVNGKKCLCFSKSLYGFVFLNIDNLQVEFEYFPENVFNNEESFIVVEARNLGNLIIFDGCYWACPYGIYAYDYVNKRFFNLTGEYGLVYDVEGNILDGILTITGRSDHNKHIEVSLSEQDVQKLIDKKGTKDF